MGGKQDKNKVKIIDWDNLVYQVKVAKEMADVICTWHWESGFDISISVGSLQCFLRRGIQGIGENKNKMMILWTKNRGDSNGQFVYF